VLGRVAALIDHLSDVADGIVVRQDGIAERVDDCGDAIVAVEPLLRGMAEIVGDGNHIAVGIVVKALRMKMELAALPLTSRTLRLSVVVGVAIELCSVAQQDGADIADGVVGILGAGEVGVGDRRNFLDSVVGEGGGEAARIGQ